MFFEAYIGIPGIKGVLEIYLLLNKAFYISYSLMNILTDSPFQNALILPSSTWQIKIGSRLWLLATPELAKRLLCISCVVMKHSPTPLGPSVAAVMSRQVVEDYE